MSINVTGESLINGTWQTGAATTMSKIYSIDPVTGNQIGDAFSAVSEDQIDDACSNAWSAFETYRTVSAPARADLLESMADELVSVAEQLVPVVIKETALPEARVRGELGRTTGQIRLFSMLLRSGDWNRIRTDPAQPGRDPVPKPELRLRYRPIGPVAVFGASNFPLAFSVAGGDTISALAAGCSVVIKAHPAHPATSEIVARALDRALAKTDLPKGVVSLIHGGPEVGLGLVRHPRIRAVGFTGSRDAGCQIMEAAAARDVPIPVFAEMSSVNPVFVLPNALEHRTYEIANKLAQSICLGAGQFCTNPGLVFLVGNKVNQNCFADKLAENISAASGEPMLTPGIADNYASSVERLGKQPGVLTIAIGKAAGLARPPCLFRVSVDEFIKNKELQAEAFGASSLLVDVPSTADMSSLLDHLEGQLTATLHLDEADAELAQRLLPLVEDRVGRILVNGFPTGVEVSPAMVHGGPFPATSDVRTTSVGTLAIDRFLRPVCYQDFPSWLLPAEFLD